MKKTIIILIIMLSLIITGCHSDNEIKEYIEDGRYTITYGGQKHCVVDQTTLIFEKREGYLFGNKGFPYSLNLSKTIIVDPSPSKYEVCLEMNDAYPTCKNGTKLYEFETNCAWCIEISETGETTDLEINCLSYAYQDIIMRKQK